MSGRSDVLQKRAIVGQCLLDLVDPLRDPSILVALVLTCVEEVGQPDSWWWIAIVVLVNFLIVRLCMRLVTVCLIRCMHLLRLAIAKWRAESIPLQGEEAMNLFSVTSHGVTLRVAFGYPSRYHLYYTVEATQGREQVLGLVRYAHLSRSGATIECLEFFDDPAWLRAAFCCAEQDAQVGCSVSSSPRPSSELVVVLEEELMDQLANWMAEDYRRRFYAMLALVEAGGSVLPAEFDLLWRYELYRETEISLCEEPTPTELVAAFRLVESCASLEVREHAAAKRRQAKLLRTAQEMARWNAWVGENLVGLIPTTVFPSEQMRPCGTPVRFATSRYDLAVTYEPILLEGEQPVGYLEVVGETILTYVPQPLSERWYAERWCAERSAVRALYVLNGMLRSGGKGLPGDDFIKWIFEHEGEGPLVELARSGAPVPVPWQLVYCYGVASKYYRVPVAVLLGEENYLGYGIPGIHRDRVVENEGGPLSAELWESVQRLHGWVQIGDEEHGVWPCQADISAHQREVRRLYGGLPAGLA